MDNRKIKKVFFISENRKAICTKEKIDICDNKNNIEKTFESKNCDLFKVKNSNFLAYIEYEPIKPRDPRARRDAITAHDLIGKGKTTLIDAETLTVVEEIPHPLINPVALQENKVIVGLCGLHVVSYVRESKILYKDDHPMFCNNRDFFVLSDTHFGVLNIYSLHPGISTLNVFYFKDHRNQPPDFIGDCLYVCGIFPLMNGQFFMHSHKDGVFKMGIYEYDNRLTAIREIVCSHYIIFSELLLLSDNVTLIGRSKDNIFYLIDTNTFSIETLPLKLDSIVQMALTHNGNLIGVKQDGQYLDLDQCILKYSQTRAILYRDTDFPVEMINIITGYEGSYRRFFEVMSPVREVLNRDTAFSQDVSSVISDYDGRYVKFSGNTSEIVEKEPEAGMTTRKNML